MRVELSFDGVNWTDYSAYVRDNFTITHRAASNDFHCATNLFNFTLLYDADLFTELRAMTSRAYVKYYDDDNAVQFSGYFMPSTSYEYDGILDMQTCGIEAQDFTELLRVPVGAVEDDDVAWQNYAILDSTSPSTSIVHALFTKIGLSTDLIASGVSIPATVGAFASSSYEDQALDMLDTLLYEYGYVCNWNKEGKFEPIRWIIPSGTAYDHTFTGTDIALSIDETVAISEYEGNQVIWYGLQTASGTRLYTEDLPWEDDGDFEGYAVLDGFNYPPEASVIDDTTGDYQKVYQEYNDTGIRYKTAGKYVEEEYYMDFALSKADFSEILITSNHVVSDRYDAGLTRDVEEFFNKRARIRYRNTSGSTKLLYYMHIDADVVYKRSQRKTKIQTVSGSNKLSSYESRFIFDETTADTLCAAQTQAMLAGNRTYKFQSEENVEEGSYVRILPGNGVDATGIVIEKTYDGYTQMYSYEVAGFTATYRSVTGREVISAQVPQREIQTQTYTLADVASAKATVASGLAVSASGIAVLAQITAEEAAEEAEAAAKFYLGMFASDPETALIGQYYFNATLEPKAFRRYALSGISEVWETVLPTDDKFTYYLGTAINDIVSVEITELDSEEGGINFFDNLIAKNLFAKNIKVLTSGSVYGGDRYTSSGTVNDNTKEGFWFGASGQAKIGGSNSEYSAEDGSLTAYSGEGERRRYVRLSENAARWGNAPDGGTETEVARMIRMDVASDAVLLDGEFVGNIDAIWSSPVSVIAAAAASPSMCELINKTLLCVYSKTTSLYFKTKEPSSVSWSTEASISDNIGYPAIVRSSDGNVYLDVIHTVANVLMEYVYTDSFSFVRYIDTSGAVDQTPIAQTDWSSGYRRIAYTVGGIFGERVYNPNNDDPDRWGAFIPISDGAESAMPCYLLQSDGALRISYKTASDGSRVERIMSSGSSEWSDPVVITTSSTSRADYVQYADGNIDIMYQLNSTNYLVKKSIDLSSGEWGSAVNVFPNAWDINVIQTSLGDVVSVYRDFTNSNYLFERRLERYAPLATVKTNMGLKRGLMFRYSTTDTLAYEKGIVEVNNGTSSKLVVVPSDGTLDVSSMSNGEWKFICITQDGTLSLETATGAGSVRPSDTCFTYNGGTGSFLNVGKYGYYLSATKRIIAAVHKVSTTSFNSINLGSGIEEWGQNSNGSWQIAADGTLVQWGVKSITTGGSTVTSLRCAANTYRGTATLTFPIAFTGTGTKLSLTDGYGGSFINGAMGTSSISIGAECNSASTTIAIDWIAFGRWK